ncbi:MAG: hypothetical protein HOO08_07945, partial [Opitutae bacterium]|nr:hypothetical protein [Opitutae bacterium]
MPITITKDTHFTLIAVAAADIRTAFVVYGITLATSACTKLLFDVNFFFLRYRHFVFHKEILTTLEVIFLLGTYY